MTTTNPNCWPGTNVPRTWASAGSITPIDTHAMQVTQNLRAGAAQGVETKRSRSGARGPQEDSKAAQLRRMLATGPKTCAQLAELAQMSNKLVAPTLQHDIKAGHVVMRREAKPFVYVLADSYSLPRNS